MNNYERLSSIVSQIIKENILTKKELKKRIMPILVKNNDARRIDGLATGLLEGQTEDIKEQDADVLIQNLNELVNIDLTASNIEITNSAEKQESDEDKILSENYKISERYNNSLIEIQKLKNELQEKNKLEKKLEQIETKLQKFESLNIEKILEENRLYVQMFKITGTQIVEVPDEDIDALYLRYKTKGTRKFEKAFITEDEIIPKSYYNLKGGK